MMNDTGIGRLPLIYNKIDKLLNEQGKNWLGTVIYGVAAETSI